MKNTADTLHKALRAVQLGDWKCVYSLLGQSMGENPEETIEFIVLGVDDPDSKFRGRLHWNGSFWRSGLSLDHLDAFFSSSFADDFYAALFLHEKSKFVPKRVLQELALRHKRRLIEKILDHSALYDLAFLKPILRDQKLTKEVARTYPQELIAAIRQSQYYLDKSDHQLLRQFKFTLNLHLAKAYRDWDKLHEIFQDYQTGKSRQYAKGVIQNLSFEEILIEVVAYHEYFKLSNPNNLNNRGNVVSNEVNLCYTLNEILTDKLKYHQESLIPIGPPLDDATYSKKVKDSMPTLNTPDGIANQVYEGVDKKYPVKQLVRQTVNFYFRKRATEYYLDKYACGMCDLTIGFLGNCWLGDNAEFAFYRRNDIKVTYKERYFMSKSALYEEKQKLYRSGKHRFEKEQEGAAQTCIMQHNALHYPQFVEYKEGRKVDLGKAFHLLKMLAELLMTPRRTNMPIGPGYNYDKMKKLFDQEFLEGKKSAFVRLRPTRPEKLKRLFPTDFLVRMSRKELSKSIRTYFHWSRREVNNLVDFLTQDLEDPELKEIDFLTRPFIKIGEYHYWLSNLLRDRNWVHAIQYRILKEGLEKNTKAISDNLEAGIVNDFKKAGFQAINGFQYELRNGEKSDIDILAFRDHTLFVIELKTTYETEDLKRMQRYTFRTLHRKATQQLDKGLKFLGENIRDNSLEELRVVCKEEGLDLDADISKFKIVPLIVSNTFDWDGARIQGRHLKIGLFELLIILKNDLYYLLNKAGEFSGFLREEGKEKDSDQFPDLPVSFFDSGVNRFNPAFKPEPLDTSKEASSLWTEPDHCSADDLLSAIEEDKVWNFLDKLWDWSIFANMGMKIGPYKRREVNPDWMKET